MRSLLAVLLLFGCDSCGSEPSARPSAPVSEEAATGVETPEAQTEEQVPEVEPAEEACSHVVFDEDPPSRVRSGPGSSNDAVGDLANGTFVRVVETRGGWARIEGPHTGWMYRRNLYDTCASPAAAPAIPLGPRTYVLLEKWDERSGSGGELLPKPPMDADHAVMEIRRRSDETVPSATITLVTKTGACVRESTRRVQLGADCPDWGVEALALEVESCPELTRDTPERDYITNPMMVGVFGRHEAATLRAWEHEESEAPETQLAAVRARLRPSPNADVPIYTRFGNSSWSWIYSEERHWLFKGDALIDVLGMTANNPDRVVAGGSTLVVVGNFGHHGYGFYMVPKRPLPEQARELWYPNFTCGAY